jgi:outer membrane protein assembly factor BamB
MKPKTWFSCILLLCGGLLRFVAMAQGTFNANNNYIPAGASTKAYVLDSAGNPLAKAYGRVEILSGGITLSPNGSTGVPLTLDGMFFINGMVVPGTGVGGTATLVVRTWDVRTGATFDAATLRDSAEVVIRNLGGGSTPPATFGNNSTFAGLRLSVGLTPPPVVTMDPVSVSPIEGQSFTLTAAIEGFGVSYRWQRDEVDLSDSGRVSGATTQTLTIAGASSADSGNYRLVGTSAAGVAATRTATVTVTATPFASLIWSLNRTATEAPVVAIDDVTGSVVLQTSNPGLLTRLDLATGNVLWEVPVSGGNRSAPTIISGVQVVFGTDALPNGWVYGYDLVTGGKLWGLSLDGAPSATSFDGVDALHFATVGNHLGGGNQYVRLDRAGIQNWKVGAPNQSRTCPVILRSGLLIYGGGSFNQSITAIRASDGGTVWSFNTGGEVYMEPSLGPGGRILATSRSERIFALNASTGAKLWEAAVGAEPGTPICDAVGRVYVGARGGRVLAFNGSTGIKLWEMTHGETSDNSILTLDNQGFIWCGGDKSAIAINSVDGSVMGRQPMTGGVSSVMIAKGGILVARTGNGAAAFRSRGVKGISSDSPWPTWRHDAAGTSLEGFTSDHMPPAIASSPGNVALAAGQTLNLTASIAGAGVSYRWQKDGQVLVDGGRVSGATTQRLTVTSLIEADAGQYRLMASNAFGTVFTSAATVVVDPPPSPPSIVSQPRSVTATEGDRVTLSVLVIANPAPSYRWLKDGVVIPGQTSSTLELPALTEADAGVYRVVVSNSAGSTDSTEVVVVCQPALQLFADGVRVEGVLRTARPVSLELQFSRPDWILFYTFDGNTPDFLSNPYGAPFLVDRPMDLRVIAYSPDFTDSQTLSGLLVQFVQPQTVTWTALPNLRYQEKGPIGAMASSGLPVVVSVLSGPATVSGGELIATGVGDVVLRAVQPGNELFAAALTEHRMTIGKGAQTLTWPTLLGRAFGDPAFSVAVGASSGLAVSVSLVSGKASLQGTTLSIGGAGKVVLSATQGGSALYEAVTETRTLEISKGAQSISFLPLPDRPYSPDPIPLVATSSSKLPVAFEWVSGPAEVSAGKVTLTGVGVVTLRAMQAGNDDYLAAPPVERSFLVSKATQTLTFNPVGQRTFGDAAVNLVATSSAGLDLGYRILSGPGSVDGRMLSVSAAGTVLIQAFNEGNALYEPAATSQSVTVLKAPQSITFTALPDIGYSTNPIVVAATAKSQLPVTFRVVDGPATWVGDRLRLTGVGVVSVAAEQSGNADWLAASPVTNRFTVTRGAQTITFESVPEQVLGNPPLTLQAASTVGLPILFEIVNGPATVSGKVLTLTGVGRVTVRARQVGSPLWLPAQVEQTFEVIRMMDLSVSTDGILHLRVEASVGTEVVLETATDLNTWGVSQRLTGQGPGKPVTFPVVPDNGTVARFWRVRVP